MKHTLMKLPFDEDALEPYLSRETIQYHYAKHHAGYVNKLNVLIKDTPYEEMGLEEIIKMADGGIFNNASQVFNHDFYFKGLTSGESTLRDTLSEYIVRDFGSLAQFKNLFLQTATNLFGSGWVWLSLNKDKHLIIESRSNADNPLLYGNIPLMTCDVWEHAYYIDYRNVRTDYLEKWWRIIDWDFVSQNLANALYIEFPCDENSGACDYSSKS